MSNLFYESHITIDPVFDSSLELFKKLSARYNFRVAELLMVKEDQYKQSTKDSFCTSRNKQYSAIVNDTIGLVGELQKHGFLVRRYKIEDTLVDSKIDDKFGLMK